MKPKGLLIAVVLLAGLGGAVWWSNKSEAAKAKNPTDAPAKILSIPEDQMVDIKIKHAGGDTIALHRDNGKWQLTEPKPLPADSDAASSLTSALSSVAADKMIEDHATDFSGYGLNTPQIDVVVTKKDGKTDELQLGDDTPTNSGTYARRAGDAHVYTVGSFVKTALNKTENDLRDKRLLTFDQDKLTRVDLQAKGPAVEFGKNGQNEWAILKPRPLRADGAQVDTLIGKLKDAKMDTANPDADAAKKFAAAAKIATATISDSAGTQTLEVRQDKDHTYFAKSSAVEGVYKITGDVGDALNKSLDDFRNKKVFDFGFSDPGKIELKGVTYTKSGDKWMSGTKTMDNSSVQNLIDKMRDLTATKFVEKGGGQPVFEATVTSNNGKRTEKVTIYKSLDQYFAQRDGEPSIYELDSKAVEDLQKAASDVKEQAPPPPAPAKKK
ncbi:MAG TPA: DUF4340 domain-containing protein [Candidatus Sulfopaludibacter sp.]|jgi:hypothetical protein|nr:DUF4340 domain-containing protein [Candidatus Sulfopaludibacter sp.]